ncbi:MAG TPA: sugar phosphate nucleotidyltransferase [Limnochordia bacterium]|nr:sugar phosphate nucleotidyltransferase [Limnochordia bacterium]
MKAIIPVAGIGSRLRPFTHTTPKALLHVAGKPVLGHILDSLAGCGVDEVVLVVGYLGEKIVRYVRERTNFKVTVVEQEDRRGLGHAVWLARTAFGEAPEPALIVLGDSIITCDAAGVVAGGVSTLAVKAVADPKRYGVVQLDGERIVRLVEKPSEPPSDLAVCGFYYLARAQALFAALERVIASGRTTRGEIQLTDALQVLIDQGEALRACRASAWLDCGSPEVLLEANRQLLDAAGPGAFAPRAGVVLIPPVSVAPSARLADCVIGPYVSVADHAVIERAVVRSSIISAGAHVQDALLADSIIGEQAGVSGHYARLNVGDSSWVRPA